MNKRFFLVLILFMVLFIGMSAFFALKRYFAPQKTHYHAGFVVFQNNKKLDFSDNKYMFIEPCTANDKHVDSEADIQIEKAHLHENVGDLVHVERTGAKWEDLFTNIHFPIDYSQTTGFINGKQISNFQQQPIKPYDSLVVFIGKNDQRLLSQAVTKEYIIKMAKKSTTCGD
jgi:hypothetical protein